MIGAAFPPPNPPPLPLVLLAELEGCAASVSMSLLSVMIPR